MTYDAKARFYRRMASKERLYEKLDAGCPLFVFTEYGLYGALRQALRDRLWSEL